MNSNPDKTLLQFVRYLMVGGFNTLFGYGLFALLNWLFTDRLGPFSYMYASVLAGLISITVAFLGYKWFVFRTKGNYLVEWLRCIGVYGSSVIVGLVGLPILVPILRQHLDRPQSASYIAAAVMTIVTVLFSFVGHKNVSFRENLAHGDAKR